jgi:hypothetical protein
VVGSFYLEMLWEDHCVQECCGGIIVFRSVVKGSFYSGLFRRDHTVQDCCGGTILVRTLVVDIIVFRTNKEIILLTNCRRVPVFLYQHLTVV